MTNILNRIATTLVSSTTPGQKRIARTRFMHTSANKPQTNIKYHLFIHVVYRLFIQREFPLNSRHPGPRRMIGRSRIVANGAHPAPSEGPGMSFKSLKT